jgi:hypothetical protein
VVCDDDIVLLESFYRQHNEPDDTGDLGAVSEMSDPGLGVILTEAVTGF